ncbi:alpha/beta-hydrolase [Ramaria rubella]|nr:alpha/beta-hydrolase [Ramaria rubella]
MRLSWPPCAGWLLLELLYLSNVYAAPADGVPSAASFYVPRLPDLQQAYPLHIYAGHLPSDPNALSAAPTDVTAHLFFLLLKARRTSDKERIIFWFNGGPGCSSFDGAMMESGPFRMDGKGGVKLIDGGWEEYSTIVFLDQPAGTGFSYTSTDKFVHELTDAADQVVQFLRNFYDVFPEYRTMDTYLSGESYAGQFIPYTANAILNSNLNIPLRGAAIGNGWMDGRTQYPAFLPFSLKMGLFVEGSQAHQRAVDATNRCMKYINDTYGPAGPVPASIPTCERILSGIVASSTHNVDGKPMCLNMYDVRLIDTTPACGMNWPPALPDIKKYLGRQDVVRALHATRKSESWQECSGRVHQELRNTKSMSGIGLFPSLLQKIKIMVFAGDQDLICNHLGIEMMIDALDWNGQVGLGDAKTQGWSVNGSDAGTWVEARNLTYVKVFNGSHMVPWDVPHVTHDMILRFMGVDFSTITGGSAQIPSNVGVDFKPSFQPIIDQNKPQTGTTVPGIAKTPEQDKAMWEAYYNAGSAALVLVLIALAIGIFFWVRARRRRQRGIQMDRDYPDEVIPLHDNRAPSPNGRRVGDEEEEFHQRKGKARAESEVMGEAIFNVGDSDEEDDRRR